MVDEKVSRYEHQDTLPIPTYEEAISSRPSSSSSFLGPSEVSHDAERQGLLSHGPAPSNGYEPPSVESARSSLDLLSSSGASSARTSARTSAENLRRETSQMDIVEADDPNSRVNRFSKRITSLTHSLSSINLPFRQWLPSREYIRARTPAWPQALQIRIKPNWILVGRIFAIVLVVSIIWLFFVSDLFSFGRGRGSNGVFPPNALRTYVQEHIKAENIGHNLEYLTSMDHVAGTEGGSWMAGWVEAHFNNAGLENVGLERFDVYLNFPKEGGRKVALIDPPELAWEAEIEEGLAYPKEFEAKQTLVFHGHSKSGNITGPLIYANYGSREDFHKLVEDGIDLKEAIVLVRYYGTQGDRAMKVKAAAVAGAAGCIIYSDPANDGFIKGPEYPKGRYMPKDGVQRGSVAISNWIVGDVLSPGYASLPGEKKRDSREDNPGLQSIPSIPLAWRDAQKLLQALKGHGKKIEDAKIKGGVPNVEWWTGDSKSPIVQLMNEQVEKDREPIYNVLGKITGIEQPEKSIIVGNHRDAWCFGAADPGSGTAIMLEVIRVFGELIKAGWKPLRTIEFASWDGEEANMIGSTEHVEARIEDLRRDGFAYLNVDVAVTGSELKAEGPVFESALYDLLGRVTDPGQNKTLREIWNKKKTTLSGLGSGSDYVAFQDLAGTSSLDMSFDGPKFPYHSCYDNFEWMAKYGDPGFQYHKTLAQIWALLILDMADKPLLPFDLNIYAREVKKYVLDLEKYATARLPKRAPKGGKKKPSLDLSGLKRAADGFVENAKRFHGWGKAWEDTVAEMGGFESNALAVRRMEYNNRMAEFETNLLDLEGGIPGREQFKHIIFAPQAWSGYDVAYFPAVRDAVDEGEWELAQRQADKAAGILSNAVKKLSE
ncbi:MAG: hypothetical protein LQ342_000051 [Letrouitia transgressa]|nr:MAG: hypothetical protein LQ342_000051 [Letrouitia transgressa]